MRIVWSTLVLAAASAASSYAHQRSPELSASATSDSEVSLGQASPMDSAGAEMGGPLSIRRIETRLGAGDAQDLVIEFDGPAPDDRVAYTDEISPADATFVRYRTQEWTPGEPAPL